MQKEEYTPEAALQDAAQLIEFAAFELAGTLPSEEIAQMISIARDVSRLAEKAASV